MQARVYPPYSPNVAPGKMERRHTCASNQGCIHILLCYQIIFPQLAFNSSLYCLIDCESFARRTFTNPKIRTFTTPKFGHFPPPKKNICQEDNCHTQFFFFFFWCIFLGFFDLQLMEDIKDGRLGSHISKEGGGGGVIPFSPFVG